MSDFRMVSLDAGDTYISCCLCSSCSLSRQLPALPDENEQCVGFYASYESFAPPNEMNEIMPSFPSPECTCACLQENSGINPSLPAVPAMSGT
jgi:hypothetical protein